jgi:23S rRNA (cytosine1962-C5)-methyltransferase
MHWRLKSGFDRRFRAGHPWVYSNELTESPKGIAPGEPVTLSDAGGKFLARGYGNPHSLIAFRVLSRDPEGLDPLSVEGLRARILSARDLRATLGLESVSYRLMHGEADGIPGLVIDRYRLASGGGNAQAFVIQAHTAGVDRVLPQVLEALEPLIAERPSAIVLRNDLSVRKLEGITEEPAKVEATLPGVDLARAEILVKSASGGEPLRFSVDLVGGQKTGFFLDQAANIELAIARLGNLGGGRTKIRALDLCTYVGQWGAQLARAFPGLEVLAVDASDKALAQARENIERAGARCETLKGDVLRDLESLPAKGFDLVISDPPALIKSRKDVGAGTHAYLQLNTQAMRLLKRGGGIVSCSCSALLEEESFIETLGKAASRNRLDLRWVGRGAQSPDHPLRTEFPEGRYLKGWIGLS